MNPALIERHRGINTDYEWWDSVYDSFTDDMRFVGIDVDKMYFSGFWSQGDGACFEGDVSDWSRFLFTVDIDYNNPILIDHARNFFSFSCKHRGHYHHALSVSYDTNLPLPESSIDMDFAGDYSPYPLDDIRTMAWLAVLNRYDSAILEKHFRNAFTGHMEDLYDRLETEHDYLTSDESVWDAIVANDMHLEENNDE